MAERKRRAPTKATDAQILAAIAACGGVYREVGAKVGMSRQAVTKRIEGNDELRTAAREARAEIIDYAESGLFKAIKAGKAWAIRFALSRLAKDRGYSMGLQVAGEIKGGQIVLTLPDDGRDSGEPDGGSSSS